LINWKHNRQNLVVENLEKANSLIKEVNSITCHFSKNNIDFYKILEKIISSFTTLEIRKNIDKYFLDLFETKNFFLLMTHSPHSIKILIKILIQVYFQIHSHSNKAQTTMNNLSHNINKILKSLKEEKCENESKCVICKTEFLKKIFKNLFEIRPISSTPRVINHKNSMPNKSQTLINYKTLDNINKSTTRKVNTNLGEHPEYVSNIYKLTTNRQVI
jgi:hypothetical protein